MTSSEFRQRHGAQPVAAGGSKPQIRLPKMKGPNKTEAEYIAILERKFTPDFFRVLYEPFTLRLPSGTRYTPDAVVVDGALTDAARIRGIYEIKGPHIHNPASLRAFKEARAAFPFWKFVFVQKRKGEWGSL